MNEIVVKFEAEPGFISRRITKIEHPLLQVLADNKDGGEFHWMSGFVFLGADTMAYLKVYPESVCIECISTVVEKRNTGSATKVMNVLIEAAKKSQTKLTLRATKVTGNGFMMLQHPVIQLGMTRKGCLPAGSLHKWYAKFGFEITKKRRGVVEMEFDPNVKK